MSSEVVIYDQFFNDNNAEIAKQEASRVNLLADIYRDAVKAADSVGFFTVSVVASIGPTGLLHSPLQSAVWLDLPHAVLQAEQMPNYREKKFITDLKSDVLITRLPEDTVIHSLRKWFEEIRNSAA